VVQPTASLALVLLLPTKVTAAAGQSLVVDSVTCFHGFIDNDLTGGRDEWVLGDRAALSAKPASVLTESVLMQSPIADNKGYPISRRSAVA